MVAGKEEGDSRAVEVEDVVYGVASIKDHVFVRRRRDVGLYNKRSAPKRLGYGIFSNDCRMNRGRDRSFNSFRGFGVKWP